jgi:hypothetical protein
MSSLDNLQDRREEDFEQFEQQDKWTLDQYHLFFLSHSIYYLCFPWNNKF